MGKNSQGSENWWKRSDLTSDRKPVELENPASLSVNGVIVASTEYRHSEILHRSWVRILINLSQQKLLWAIAALLAIGGLGFGAMSSLIQLSQVSCLTVNWFWASASTRLYCAQEYANQRTGEDLLKAIALIDELPKNHFLRPEINRQIKEWSQELLNLTEETFQQGKLEEAMGIAGQIPKNNATKALIAAKIAKWESIWAQGEKIYSQAEDRLRVADTHGAFNQAIRLTNIGNRYWATTKYDQLVNIIQIAQEDAIKLDKAYLLLKKGDVDKIGEAVKIAEEVDSKSYAYLEAQKLLDKAGNQLLELAETRIYADDWQNILEITNKLPNKFGSKPESQDLLNLATALSKAEQGLRVDLESAISLAQKVESGRPLYDKAQKLVARWQLEIQDVARLEKARELASPGELGNVLAAIAEARQIPTSHPRYSEAQSLIQSWENQVETSQDEPYLTRANQLANLGTVSALRDAIAQASFIPPGRALYPEAQNQIRQWTRQLQKLEDTPYLAQAQSQADSGNYSAAIATAQQITSDRALYPQAQSKIRQWTAQVQGSEDQPYLQQAQNEADLGNLRNAILIAKQISSDRALYVEAQRKISIWQREVQAQDNLQAAYQLSYNGAPESLSKAIQTARKIPVSSLSSSEAQEAINRWSSQLLSMAQDVAANDRQKAIGLAQIIPPTADVYQSAQAQIDTWQGSN
jgi:hypothetical protein